jgi:hypothetical protein
MLVDLAGELVGKGVEGSLDGLQRNGFRVKSEGEFRARKDGRLVAGVARRTHEVPPRRRRQARIPKNSAPIHPREKRTAQMSELSWDADCGFEAKDLGALGLGEAVLLGDRVGDADGALVGEGVLLGVGVVLGDAECVGAAECVGFGVLVGDGLCVGVGGWVGDDEKWDE